MDIVAREVADASAAIEAFPAVADFPFQTACGVTYDSGNYQGRSRRRVNSPAGIG